MLKGVIAFLLAAAFATGALAGEGVQIRQKDWKFRPDAVEITQGGTLEISNDDPRMHHLYVDSPDFTFDSGEQPSGKTVVIEFPRSGDYEVLCAIHPKMKLTVRVK